ncbi:MAG: TRASH domain-containing protein [Holophagaceae bacterium]|nr:TRASH domain-containing protein [Holophagaceae bacterium]
MLTPLVFSALIALAGPATAAPTNTICPVLGNAVTPGKSPIVTVRGRQYYICCPGCDAKLIKNPDQYLEKDGTPKNAKGKKS